MNKLLVRPLKLFVLYCTTSFNAEELTNTLHETGDDVKIIGLPCSGKVDVLYLIKAFEKGADGLVLLTCSKNECHQLQGNLRATRRAEGVNSIIEETGLGKERMTVLALQEDGLSGIVSGISDFSLRLRQMDFNSEGLSLTESVAVNC